MRPRAVLDRRAVRAVLVALAPLLAACPPAGTSDARDAAPQSSGTVCARVGQTCEVSPGKLGSCVERDDCPSPPCFVCQSQH